jgi:hypothetical protein
MNFQPLFTTARVITAVYRIASTTLLLIYLAQRLKTQRRVNPASHRFHDRTHVGTNTHSQLH